MKLLLALIFISHSTFANDQNLITWTRWNIPPLYIMDGTYKDQGILDRVEKYIKNQLTEYRHRSIETTIQRNFLLTKENPALCNAGMLKLAHVETLLHLSNSYGTVFIDAFIKKAKDSKSIAPKETYLLSDELINPDTTVGIAKPVDPRLTKLIKNKKAIIENITSQKTAFKMLFKDRVDYLVGFPVEANYYSKILNNKKKLVVISVNKKNSAEVAFACSKSRQGREVIKRINQILKNEIHQTELSKIVHSWDN